jgi:hypothetical protein
MSALLSFAAGFLIGWALRARRASRYVARLKSIIRAHQTEMQSCRLPKGAAAAAPTTEDMDATGKAIKAELERRGFSVHVVRARKIEECEE